MSALRKKTRFIQVSAMFILTGGFGGCASYKINSTDLATFKTNPTAGLPYFLPKLEIDATVKWTILSCTGVSNITLQTEITEVAKYVADTKELHVLDAQKAVGGLLDHALSLNINEQGVLTAFDSKTTGQGVEVVKELGTLVASVTSGFGVPLVAGPQPATCSYTINGKTLGDWGKLRENYSQELKQIEALEYKNGNLAFIPKSISKEDLEKVWIDPQKAKTRRDYLLERLAYIDKQTSFTRTVTFDPVSTSIASITIPDKDIAWASAGTLTKAERKTLSDKSEIKISTTSGVPISNSKPTNVKNSKNALIFRVPGPIELTYELGTFDAKTSQHMAPQAGSYAMIPIKSDAFGSVQTKVTFSTNGMVSTYGFDSTTGLAEGLSAANGFRATLEGAEDAAIVAETERIKNLLALKEQQKKLREFDESTPSSTGN